MNEKATLFYVDDEPINLMLFKSTFKRKYNVITAESGSDGLTGLRLNPEIKFVISDMRMPGMSGVEFITLAKREFPNIAFSILTGYDITEEISDALKKGLIFKYLRKPFNVDEIEGSISKALESSH